MTPRKKTTRKKVPKRKAKKKTAKRPVGRPRAIGEKERAEIIAVVTVGGSVGDAAAYTGISLTTVQREVERNPKFRDSLTRAAASMKMTQVRKIAGSDDWRAAGWLLARKWPQEYSDAVAKQLSVSMTPQQLMEMTDEDLYSLIGRLGRGEGGT